MSQRLLLMAYGLPAMGKTLYLHDFIRNEGAGHTFFIVDRADEWGSDAVHWRGQAPSPLTVVNGLGEVPKDFEPGLYVFRECDPLAIAKLAIEVGHVVYVDDEIDLTATRERWMENPIRAIVHQGRHLRNREGEICQVHLLGACRRPQSIHPDLTQMLDRAIIFRVAGDLTLDRLRRDSMVEDDELETVRTLPTFHFREYPTGSYGAIPPLGAKKGEDEAPTLPAVQDPPEENSGFTRIRILSR